MDKKSSDIFKSFLPAIIVFALQMGISMMAAFLVLADHAYHYVSGSLVQFLNEAYRVLASTDFNAAVMIVYAVVASTLFIWWYNASLRSTSSEHITRDAFHKNPAVFVVGFLLLAFGMQYLANYFVEILSIFFPQWLADYEVVLEGLGLSDTLTLPVLFYTFILGPVCEEYAFRGISFGYARRALPFWAANVLQAFLFAAMHMNMLQVSYAFFLGLLLGYFVERTGSMALSIALHIGFNTAGILGGLFMPQSENPVSFFMTLFATMAATYGGILMLNGLLPPKKEEH